MTKGELRTLIREVLTEELSKQQSLHEEVEGPGYVIKAWKNPDIKNKNGMPDFDSAKKGIKYADYDALLAALKSSELDELGAYEITWVQSGEKLN
jgi:hypothetical protein